MKNKKIRYGQVFDHIALILLLILVLFPFYILIVNSFKLPKDILKNPFAFPGTDAAPLLTTGYAVAWRYIKGYILNTVIVAAMEVAGTYTRCAPLRLSPYFCLLRRCFWRL
mgnify:CR=1 FL=1